MIKIQYGRILAVGMTAMALAIGTPAVGSGPTVSTEWADKNVPIEVLAQFPMISQPKLSPDGKWVATKIRADRQQVLAILPIAGGKPVIIAHDGEAATDKQGERNIYDYEWADSDHLVIEFGSRDNYAGQWFDNVRYASYNRNTQKIIPLGWDNAFAGTGELWMSQSGPPHMLLERSVFDDHSRNGPNTEQLNNPEVIDVDLDTGRYKTVMKSNSEVTDWVADEDGVVRMGSSRDRYNGKLQVLYRDRDGQPLRTVYNGIPDRYEGAVLPNLFPAGGGKAYAYAHADGYRALFEYDLSKMALGKKVFGVPGYDIGGVDLTPDRKSLSSVSYTAKREERFYFDPRLRAIQEMLEDSFGKGNVLIASADAARETILFRVAAMGQAETWYVFHTVSGQVGMFAYGNETLKNAQLNPVSVVTYPASDGKKIEAILTMPRHRGNLKNLPLIVLPHGGPWARDKADWDPYGWAQSLAEMGYVVIQPNYRGSTGYGSEWAKASEKAWGYRMQDDLNDAIPWLASQGIVDPKRVCMFGWSYGGYAASRAAERDGDKYRCAISGAGVHDLPAMMRYDKDYLGRYGAKMGMGSASGDLVDASPGLHPEKYSIPILIVQGAKDQRVPPSQARDLVARLKKAGKVEGKDFFYVEQPLNTHNLLREEDRIQLMQEVKKFLDRFNPAT